MKRAARIVGCILAGAVLTGCQALADIEPTPADGTVAYVRELCQLTPAERAQLLETMAEAVAPDHVDVRCRGR